MTKTTIDVFRFVPFFWKHHSCASLCVHKKKNKKQNWLILLIYVRSNRNKNKHLIFTFRNHQKTLSVKTRRYIRICVFNIVCYSADEGRLYFEHRGARKIDKGKSTTSPDPFQNEKASTRRWIPNEPHQYWIKIDIYPSRFTRMSLNIL